MNNQACNREIGWSLSHDPKNPIQAFREAWNRCLGVFELIQKHGGKVTEVHMIDTLTPSGFGGVIGYQVCFDANDEQWDAIRREY